MKSILFTERSCQNKLHKVSASLRAKRVIYVIASAGMKNRKASRLVHQASGSMWIMRQTVSAHTLGIKPLRLTTVPELLLWHWTVIKLFCVYVRNAGATWLIMRPAKSSQEQGWGNVLKERFILQKSRAALKAASFGLPQSWRKAIQRHI